MSDSKQPEGFIPGGLVIDHLCGTLEGVLTIAGEVENVELQAGHLCVTETGVMKDGQVEADSIVIDGSVSGVTFTTPRLSAGAGARISDCVIEMGSPTGCAIHEDACFEGDVRISVSRKGGAGGSASGSGSSRTNSTSSATPQANIPAGDDEPDLHWPAQTPDISEADQDADIPLGG
ncbi:polymer-forming cytoskeletal protein [Parasaccharibacter sp. TMW2.1890]|uniref:polymer-forming cytoskeletal protein n=1 Tax=Parasaccharibacter sp. TMW2.1890 TaxID=2039289 RepID=UPI0020119873|nr:polymer-forming cytoskeletal protein [Parasaccharibacter sp. TMW2.1890]MCL1515505.1 hypothetical protein [Parasaccharibacter sp. TMW2.1890]